jgi:hypothetical protein
MMPTMPRNTTPHLFGRVVRRLTRWVPHSEPAEERDDWVDSDPSWHNSSFDLARGLVVTELFEERRVLAAFADTMPAFHAPQPTTQAGPRP